MIRKLIATALLVSASAAVAAPDCKDVDKVAKEAVAYALVGAYAPFTTHACFKHEHFEYFRPEKGYATGEVLNAKGLIFFDKRTD